VCGGARGCVCGVVCGVCVWCGVCVGGCVCVCVCVRARVPAIEDISELEFFLNMQVSIDRVLRDTYIPSHLSYLSIIEL